ncbi:hypothetical protein [Pseudoalteromonas sp. JC3]|uniref:hypothetical protein n=1 Tax=Pseudoalteromonas sp. JC3 TaxID=2810196 RepID=UPI0019D192DE|nr:hypothetical protein [Pseudoalteromonas sp. JC3]MBR8844363.1 hypothetical protein [Pseudoalteromonas sp. JC3]WJE09927.1 hypothetical protein QSH61_05545 [Pseudoalteromonas sp. JC3]
MKYWQALIVIFLGAVIAGFTLRFANIGWQNPTYNPPSQTKPEQEKRTETLITPINTYAPIKPNAKTSPKAVKPITEPEYLPPINQAEKQMDDFQGDLSDTEAYQAYLDQKDAKLKQQYIAAVDGKVAQIEALLARGVKEGLPQQQLQEARDKITALKDMQSKLRTELSERDSK